VRTPEAWVQISQQGKWSGRPEKLVEAHRHRKPLAAAAAVGGKQMQSAPRLWPSTATSGLPRPVKAWRPAEGAARLPVAWLWWSEHRHVTPGPDRQPAYSQGFQAGAGKLICGLVASKGAR